MSRQPFEFYVDSYNMVGKSRCRAEYRFSKQAWHSLMQYRQFEIDDAVKEALKKPKFELLKEWRFRDIMHTRCMGGLAGQAFRNYVCEGCNQELSWPNTATPKFCNACAIRGFKCQRCGESLESELSGQGGQESE